MKLLTLVLALTSSIVAHAGEISCNLVNAAGAAKLEAKGNEGTIRGLTGESIVKKVEAKKVDLGLAVTVTYESRLAAMQGGHDDVEVTLLLVPTPMTSLMGVNYQGALYLPSALPALAFPGPFQTPPSGWNNPFPGMMLSMIPTGYVMVAVAYCGVY
jgi:hypothetical protein